MRTVATRPGLYVSSCPAKTEYGAEVDFLSRLHVNGVEMGKANNLSVVKADFYVVSISSGLYCNVRCLFIKRVLFLPIPICFDDLSGES